MVTDLLNKPTKIYVMKIVWMILIIIAALVLFSLVMRYIESLPKKRLEARKKKEKWGEMIEPEPDIYWDLGREVITDRKRLNSRPYLEGLGFKFLGYSNEKLLWVEPPIGWRKEYNGNLHTKVFDETGKHRFTYFYKNDIMNMSDYRAELHAVA